MGGAVKGYRLPRVQTLNTNDGRKRHFDTLLVAPPHGPFGGGGGVKVNPPPACKRLFAYTQGVVKRNHGVDIWNLVGQHLNGVAAFTHPSLHSDPSRGS